MNTPAFVTLVPGRWIALPGTRCEVRWDGTESITVYQHGEFWDLSPVVSRSGEVRAWARIARAGRPVTPPWPILAPSDRRPAPTRFQRGP